MVTGTPAEAFLQRAVAAFNLGVRTRDFSTFLDLLDDDAVLDFEGIPDGPVAGRAAISERYREDPPDDEICIRRWRDEGSRIVAEFIWCDIPEARGGDLILYPRNDRIARITVVYGGPASRWR